MISPFPIAWPLYAATIALAAIAAGGLGRIALAGNGCVRKSRLRQSAAEFAVGMLGFFVLVACLSEANARLEFALAMLGGFLVAGLLAFAIQEMRRTSRSSIRIGVIAFIAASLLIAGLTPVNPGAADPVNYAYITATLFRLNWVTAHLNAIPSSSWYIGLARTGMLTRSPAVALLWPPSVWSFGVEARTVAALAAWFTAISFMLVVDLLHGQAPLAARALLALGALGAFNSTAVLVGGQINQAFAIAAALTSIWLYRWLPTATARVLAIVLGATAITAAYPEFLAALPLYFLCMALLGMHTWRHLATATAGLAGGVALILLLSKFAVLQYVLSQAGQGPGWWPLPEDPNSVADIWRAAVLQYPPPRLALVLVLPAVWFGWRVWSQSSGPPKRLVLGVLIALVAMLAVWTWPILQAPNANYATFKIGGWIGPGLVILTWQLARWANPLLGKPLAAALLGLVMLRGLGMAANIVGLVPDYAVAQVQAPEVRVDPDGACHVVLSSSQQETVAAAIASSAAPARDCDLIGA